VVVAVVVVTVVAAIDGPACLHYVHGLSTPSFSHPALRYRPLLVFVPTRSPEELRIYQRTPWDAIDRHGVSAWRARMGEEAGGNVWRGGYKQWRGV
jgi:hypothetical protein